ncbi:MAG: ABC transporter permease [candidate division Zixibacteria bacterium]
MSKFRTVFNVEYSQVVKKKSFLVGIFLTPIIMIAFTVLPAVFATQGVSPGQDTFAIIDMSGSDIGQRLADAITEYKLDNDSTQSAHRLYQLYHIDPDNTHALDSMRSFLDSLILDKEVDRYVIIMPNAEKTDSVLMISKSLGFRIARRFDRIISNILTKKRFEGSNIDVDVDKILSLTRRIDMIQKAPGGKTRDFLSIYFGALIFILIVFASVMGFGQILMRSIIDEKNSRIVEVLVSSVSPFQLMMGKVLGLGAANLTQVAVWLVIGLGIFIFRGAFNIPAHIGDIIFNPVIILFFVLFMVIAYIMYSTIFALIGSICNTDKEAQNFIFPITILLMLPIILLMYMVQQPDSTFSKILSFIPLLTPTMMVARINIMAPESFSFADPIVIEAGLGVLTSALFTVGLIWVAARIFRVGILMYGKRATLPEILKWIKYR